MKNQILIFLFCIFTFCTYAQKSKDFIDTRDGQKYSTVKIGKQIWMSQNLNFETDSLSYCYNNDTANCNKYGRLYNWYMATSSCPVGWRLPTKVDYDTLINFLGGTDSATIKMRTGHDWLNPKFIAEKFNSNLNSSGFSALPSGTFINSNFSGLGFLSLWWTATEFDKANAYYAYIENKFRIKGNSKNSLTNKTQEYYSVRCIKE